MDSALIHADVFFFVSTILLTVLVLAFVAAIIYLITLMNEAKAIVRLVRREAENAVADIGALRAKIKESSFLPGILAFLSGLRGGRSKRGKK